MLISSDNFPDRHVDTALDIFKLFLNTRVPKIQWIAWKYTTPTYPHTHTSAHTFHFSPWSSDCQSSTPTSVWHLLLEIFFTVYGVHVWMHNKYMCACICKCECMINMCMCHICRKPRLTERVLNFTLPYSLRQGLPVEPKPCQYS